MAVNPSEGIFPRRLDQLDQGSDGRGHIPGNLEGPRRHKTGCLEDTVHPFAEVAQDDRSGTFSGSLGKMEKRTKPRAGDVRDPGKVHDEVDGSGGFVDRDQFFSKGLGQIISPDLRLFQANDHQRTT
jgi:hypothetical protein